MERNVEGLVEAVVLLEVRPLRAPGDEDEVTRRGDREELGEALDDAEDEGLAVRQRLRVVRHAGDREDRRESERRPGDGVDDRAAHGEILRAGPGETRLDELDANCVKRVNRRP